MLCLHLLFCYKFFCGHMEENEEEDRDSIEKVLWHQPKGMAEEADRNNKSTEPLLLSHLFDSKPEWNEIEFFIKWKGQSHLHYQWKSYSGLQTLSGFKKIPNYTKRGNGGYQVQKNSVL